METVYFLAQLWGFSLVIMCFAFLIKPKLIKTVMTLVEQEGTLLVGGMVHVVLGIASILSYNVWAKEWQVIVTILGWALLVKGIFHLVMPEKIIEMIKKIQHEYASKFSMALVAGVILGCILVYLGSTI